MYNDTILQHIMMTWFEFTDRSLKRGTLMLGAIFTTDNKKTQSS